MFNIFYGAITYYTLFLIQIIASNPGIDFDSYPDYVVILTSNVYVTVTDVQSVESLNYTTSYSTNTVSTTDTINYDITKYHTKTETHIKRTHLYVTESYTSCITETQNTYVSHIVTQYVTSDITDTSIIHSTLFSTSLHQVSTTSYQVIQIATTLTDIDTVTTTIPVKFCDATIIPKNLDELTSTLIEFHKQQEQDMNYFLNGAEQKMLKAMLADVPTTEPTFVPFNFYGFGLICVSFDLPFICTPPSILQIYSLKNSILLQLYQFQQADLKLLQSGASQDVRKKFADQFVISILTQFDSFFNYCFPDYLYNLDIIAKNLIELYQDWLIGHSEVEYLFRVYYLEYYISAIFNFITYWSKASDSARSEMIYILQNPGEDIFL